MSAIEVSGLSHAYGARKVLHGVDLRVEDGSFVALLGPNGAGKSTLLSLLAGLIAPTEGRVGLAGHDLARARRQALAAVGLVFQQPSLDPDLSVERNLVYYCGLRGIGGARARAEIDRVLARFELTARRSETVRRLNGGHRRRVEIARAMIGQPRILVLDEPTVGLDVEARAALVAHAHDLARKDGVAVLWATHLVDEIEPEDEVVILHEGRIRAAGPAAKIAGADGLLAAFLRIVGAGGIGGVTP